MANAIRTLRNIPSFPIGLNRIDADTAANLLNETVIKCDDEGAIVTLVRAGLPADFNVSVATELADFVKGDFDHPNYLALWSQPEWTDDGAVGACYAAALGRRQGAQAMEYALIIIAI